MNNPTTPRKTPRAKPARHTKGGALSSSPNPKRQQQQQPPAAKPDLPNPFASTPAPPAGESPSSYDDPFPLLPSPSGGSGPLPVPPSLFASAATPRSGRGVEDLELTVLSFAQWLSDMQSRSNASVQTMAAEMSAISHGLQANSQELTELKRQTAVVQQSLQSQITALRDSLCEGYSEIDRLEKGKSVFMKEIKMEYQSLHDQMQFKTVEVDTLRTSYQTTLTSFDEQIDGLKQGVHDYRRASQELRKVSQLNQQAQAQTLAALQATVTREAEVFTGFIADHEETYTDLSESMDSAKAKLTAFREEFEQWKDGMQASQRALQQEIWSREKDKGRDPLGEDQEQCKLSPRPSKPEGASLREIDTSPPRRGDHPDMPQARRVVMPASGGGGGGGMRLSLPAAAPKATASGARQVAALLSPRLDEREGPTVPRPHGPYVRPPPPPHPQGGPHPFSPFPPYPY
ncbi:unnamed protein product [Vitrella brassicaformis CCMP3155]|uniref:Uncharacterized protein n=2 Tax=Vitrella brassicaformis TaxID=1169539 RepID=A0A0G4FHQ8_VITBC|nr:unnamed protein product [Vitrella brassicaformis CCMP3155]|eukprot:CEM13051.1 unnamed protein product [Vitrella brassicaformis CCMP3155]